MDINLSKAVRSNLLSLQNTATMMGKTQERLATGLKVNSALDNPTNFFTASALKNRAGDLGQLMDSVSNSIQTLQAADKGIKAISKLVESAQSTARQALQDRSAATGGGALTAETSLGINKGVAENRVLTDLGFAAGDTLTFSRENSTTGVVEQFEFEVQAGSTVGELVDAVNASGFAQANISDTGFLSFSVGGSDDLTVTATVADGAVANGDQVAVAALEGLGFTQAGAAGAGDDAGVDGESDTASLTVTAGAAGTNEVRAKLAAQYNELLGQIDELAADSDYNGVNLLGGTDNDLKVIFNERGSSEITIKSVDFTSSGLGLAPVSGDFATEAEINGVLDKLKGALGELRSQASQFGSNLSVVETRQDFTKDMINVLETGAANLTLADTNEEAANLLALQTRQQLSSTALSMASQADQAVLRLF
ncbi:flagellin [Pelagibacterium sediminicola]|uniref:flagellin N-terminal helical domain-containing protein n=1 Tax=Pelagibacterium sediminicola TaxID=2248761 RepID=UPI000E312743|nr:flagellin [Pelagibacterium sediminicola]